MVGTVKGDLRICKRVTINIGINIKLACTVLLVSYQLQCYLNYDNNKLFRQLQHHVHLILMTSFLRLEHQVHNLHQGLKLTG
jgi:hypothetical protein